jgi:hypothetical protein
MNVIDLAAAYRTDPDSPFGNLRYVTREGYERLLARLTKDLGARELSTLGARDFLHAHAEWIVGDKVTMAHRLMTMLRIIVGFGATVLEDKECQRLRDVLSGLRFKNPKSRTAKLTQDQGEDVRDFATFHLYYAVALAQAFQQDCALGQKDVIGEWVPLDDPEPSTVICGNEKWVRGLMREEVNADMILTHQTSKRGQVLTFDLKNCPAVDEEWFSAPPSGPLIIDPETRLPYEGWKFRRIWRRMADAASVPKNVWNMDSRAGSITHMIAGGAAVEDVRKLAGHERQETTRRNCRDVEDAIKRVLSKKNSGGSEDK